MRKHGKVDVSHAAIRDALRQLGVTVIDLSSVGEGCPDLAAHWPRVPGWILLEVKTASSRSAKMRARQQHDLTPAQVALHARAPVAIVYSLEDALEAVGLPTRIVTGTPS
mgnify:CR=1 FL=1